MGAWASLKFRNFSAHDGIMNRLAFSFFGESASQVMPSLHQKVLECPFRVLRLPVAVLRVAHQVVEAQYASEHADFPVGYPTREGTSVQLELLAALLQKLDISVFEEQGTH